MNNSRLQSLNNGLQIAYNEEIDYNNITNEIIDSIFNIVSPSNNIDDIFLDTKISEELISYTNMIKNILKKSNLSERKKIFENLVSKEFVSNVRYIYKISQGKIKENEMEEIFRKNNFLYKYDVQNIKDNYQYLRKQQLIFSEELDKMYIGNSIENIEKKVNNLLLSKEKIPRKLELLSIPSNNENKEKLVKNLTFIIKVNGLRDYDDYTYKVEDYLNHNLIENFTKYDNEKLPEKAFFLEQKYFDGVRSIIYDGLNKMNKNYINDLNNLFNTQEYNSFISNFSTIQKWDLYHDPIERANDLKDEFLTKIIYMTLKETCLTYINNEIDNNIKVNNLIKKLEKNDLVEEYKNIHINSKMLYDINNVSIDEYFDIKRRKSKAESNLINKLRNKITMVYPNSSKTFPKLFDKNKKKEDINQVLLNSLTNNLLNQHPNNEIRNKIVEDTKNLLKEYEESDKNNKILAKLLKTINYYLIVNNEYDIQNFNQIHQYKSDSKDNVIIDYTGDVKELARKIFNYSSRSNMNYADRVIYALYNSNRLAHSIEEIGIFRELNDDFVMNPNAGPEKNQKEALIKKYNFLQRFGLDIDYINTSIEDYINNRNLSIYNIIDKNNDEDLIEYINNTLDSFNKKREDITINNINEIKETLRKIKNNDQNILEKEKVNKKIRDGIYLNAKESTLLFEVKKDLINDLKKTTEKTSKKNIEDMTKEDKNTHFMLKKYVIEYQEDNSGKVVLACYDEKFNTAFSVHDITNNKKMDPTFLKNNQLISHHKNHGGLIEVKKDVEDFVHANLKLNSGFTGDYSKTAIIQSKIFNKLNINLNFRKNVFSTPEPLLEASNKLKHEKAEISHGTIYQNPVEGTGETLGDIANKKVQESLNNVMDDLITSVQNKEVSVKEDDQLSIFGSNYKFIYNNQETTFTEKELGEERMKNLNNVLNNKEVTNNDLNSMFNDPNTNIHISTNKKK